MGWEKIVKVDTTPSIPRIMNRIMEDLRNIIVHPDYNNDDLIRTLEDMDEVRIVQRLIDEIETPDSESFDALASIYERMYGRRVFLDHSTGILNNILRYYRRIRENRSMKFLQDIAETFGVEIRKVFGYSETSISFAHRGLTFELHKGGVIIRIPEINKQINICVVDEKQLPLGDFYASMLGLIISRPEELDVVNFGINLGLIILTYSGYHWNRIPRQIGIFTPFESRNSENAEFSDMLEMLGDDDHDLAPDVLEEIEGALQDCFGSTRGFF